MTTAKDASAKIRELEGVRYRAIVEKNWDLFAQLCHPALAYSHSSGNTDTLDSYMTKLRTGFYVYHDIDHPIDFVRIVDDVALVVGEMNAQITVDGKVKRLQNKSLAVWKNTDRGWRFLAYHPTPMPG